MRPPGEDHPVGIVVGLVVPFGAQLPVLAGCAELGDGPAAGITGSRVHEKARQPRQPRADVTTAGSAGWKRIPACCDRAELRALPVEPRWPPRTPPSGAPTYGTERRPSTRGAEPDTQGPGQMRRRARASGRSRNWGRTPASADGRPRRGRGALRREQAGGRPWPRPALARCRSRSPTSPSTWRPAVRSGARSQRRLRRLAMSDSPSAAVIHLDAG